MAVKKAGVGAFLAGLCLIATNAEAIDCSNLPTQFPTGNFFSNFETPCYMIPFGVGYGSSAQGDLNATYYQMFFKVDPSYQLIIVGDFPNARYFSVSTYDAHSAISQSVEDVDIVPLTSSYINPYQPGVSYVSGQYYAVPISLGGTPTPTQVGCMTNGLNVNINGLDGTLRHQFMNWNTDAGLYQTHPDTPLHIVDTPLHTNPNTAGVILIRAYLDLTGTATAPHLIVRNVATGCAYSAADAVNTLQAVTTNMTTGLSWLDQSQSQAHYWYANDYLPTLCWGNNGQNKLGWIRETEYVQGANPDSSNIIAYVPAGVPATLAAAGEVMRIRFRLPTTPPTPCTNGCSRSGTEQMRYLSLSFEDGATTLASIADESFTQGQGGFVTLIVGTGATIPSWITTANGYTFLNLTALSGYQNLTEVAMRNILPASTFTCGGNVVPYKNSEWTSYGGLMGEYLPVVDYPLASTLPQTATPIGGPNFCDMFPNGQPGVSPNCSVNTPPPITITTLTTQCPAVGCNQVAAQSQPPITILGAGFGSFPNGLPYTGNSKYLEIADTTQGWDAGYGSDACNLTVGEWAATEISIVANLGTACPLMTGDQLTVKVWNPQTNANTSFTVTVVAPTADSSKRLTSSKK
jgi:hypothetical protein